MFLQLLKDFLTLLGAYLAGQSNKGLEDKVTASKEDNDGLKRVQEADRVSRGWDFNNSLRSLRERGLVRDMEEPQDKDKH